MMRDEGWRWDDVGWGDWMMVVVGSGGDEDGIGWGVGVDSAGARCG